MTLFYVRSDRSAVPALQKENARLDIEQRAKKLDANDPGYTAALAEIIDQVVTDHSNLYRWSTDDARILRAELGNLAINNLSVYLERRQELNARKAHTALEDSKGILREEDLILRGFTRVKPSDAVTDAETMWGVVKGLGRLAASLGAPRAADGWYAREVTTTVEGDRANNIGQYGKRARRFMMPFAELRTLTPSNVENTLLLEVLSNNRKGVDDALTAMINASPGAKTADPNAAERSFILPSSVLNRANFLGTQLGGFRQYVDRQQKAPEGQFPELMSMMQENHRLFVSRNYASASPELRRPFDQLEPVVQRRNIPNVLGALYGMMQANRLVGEVIERGVLLEDGSASESGKDLQLHLVSSASHAMTLDFEGANAVFGGAVADEISLLLAYRTGKADRLSQIYDVVESAATAAGNEFQLNGRRASAAPEIAFNHIGPLMVALDPQSALSEAQWTDRARDVLKNARAEDLAKICEDTFLLDKLPKGKELGEALKKEIDGNDYFYKRIDELKPREAGEKALDDGDRELLRNLLFLTNATWKVGQVHRAINEGDLSRVNPSERERVFNPYDLCVTAAGSDLKSFFVVAKDFLVLQNAI